MMICEEHNLSEKTRNIIAKKKHYHGIRVRDKKNTYTYKSFSEKVVDQWSVVKEKSIKRSLGNYGKILTV